MCTINCDRSRKIPFNIFIEQVTQYESGYQVFEESQPNV